MSNRTQIDWSVPTEAWERFREYIRSEFGSLEGHLSREVECAMVEYAREDGYEKVEQLVDRLVQAAGRTLGDHAREKNSGASFGKETKRARPWVDESVLASFKDEADEDTGSYGRVLAKALRNYRLGGRAARLKDKLERVVDDAESMLKTVRDDENGKSMGKKERQTIAICSELPSPFSREKLEEEIKKHAGSSDYYLEEYTEQVTERLGPLKVVENDEGDDLFLTPEQWRNRILADVIVDLGGDVLTDSCPAFGREEVGKAIVDNSNIASDDSETINELIDHLLDRLGFVWDDEREVFDSPRRSAHHDTGTDESGDDEHVSELNDEFATLESGRKRAVTDGGTIQGEHNE